MLYITIDDHKFENWKVHNSTIKRGASFVAIS